MGLPAALGQCRRQPGELGNDTLYRFRPSWGRSLRVPFPDHHFNKKYPPIREDISFGAGNGTRTHYLSLEG